METVSTWISHTSNLMQLKLQQFYCPNLIQTLSSTAVQVQCYSITSTGYQIRTKSSALARLWHTTYLYDEWNAIFMARGQSSFDQIKRGKKTWGNYMEHPDFIKDRTSLIQVTTDWLNPGLSWSYGNIEPCLCWGIYLLVRRSYTSNWSGLTSESMIKGTVNPSAVRW